MYKLSVNGGLIDFVGEPKIILMTNDPGDYSFGKAHKTYYIDILNNNNNAKLIGNELSMDAVLFIDNIQISGILYIDQQEDYFSKGIFVSGVGEVFEQLRGVKLNELDWSEYNHELTYANVIARESGPGSTFIRYDLINRGVHIAQSEEGGIAADDYDVTEKYPAFRLREMIEKMFEGYEVVFDTDKYFVTGSYLYLLFTQNYEIRNSEQWQTDTNQTIETNNNYIDNHNVVGANGNFSVDVDITDLDYEPTEMGTYRLKYTLPIRLQSIGKDGGVVGSYNLRITSKLTATLTSSTRGTLMSREITYNTETVDPDDTIDIDFDTRYFELARLEEVTLNIDWTGTYLFIAPPAAPQFEAIITSPMTDVKMQIYTSRYYGVTSTVEIDKLMPDMEALEFLKELCIWLNLKIYYRPTTKQIILSQIYSTEIIDWTDKMAVNKGFEITYGDKQRIRYTMSLDDAVYTDEGIEYIYGDEGTIRDIKLFVHPIYTRLNSGVPYRIYIQQGDRNKEYTTDAGTTFFSYEYKTKAGIRIALSRASFTYAHNIRYFLFGGKLTTTTYFSAARATTPGFTYIEPSLYMETFKPTGATSIQQGLFDQHHREDIVSQVQRTELSCTLVLDNKDIVNILNIEDGKDWRVTYHLMGVNYRLLELEQLEGNIYKGRFIQIF
jgi:hypothetical protein